MACLCLTGSICLQPGHILLQSPCIVAPPRNLACCSLQHAHEASHTTAAAAVCSGCNIRHNATPDYQLQCADSPYPLNPATNNGINFVQLGELRMLLAVVFPDAQADKAEVSTDEQHGLVTDIENNTVTSRRDTQLWTSSHILRWTGFCRIWEMGLGLIPAHHRAILEAPVSCFQL